MEQFISTFFTQFKTNRMSQSQQLAISIISTFVITIVAGIIMEAFRDYYTKKRQQPTY